MPARWPSSRAPPTTTAPAALANTAATTTPVGAASGRAGSCWASSKAKPACSTTPSGSAPDLRHPLVDGVTRLLDARGRILAEPELSVDSLRGIEGAAAVGYFQALTQLFPASLDFTGRNRRPPRDPVNAALSLGYTLLHFEAVRACHVAGLDPIIGFFHELDFGRESLASDLIEPWRPRIDAWVWEQFRTRSLRDDHFTREADACLLGKTGRQHFYGAYEALARPLRRALRRYAGKLAVRLAGDGAVHASSMEQTR